MVSATFIGEVHQGRVVVPLEFEGKRVKVTLTVEDAPPDVARRKRRRFWRTAVASACRRAT